MGNVLPPQRVSKNPVFDIP